MEEKEVKEFVLNIKLEEKDKLQLLGEILQEKSISGFTQKDNFDGVCVRFQLDEKIQNDEDLKKEVKNVKELKKKMESERAMRYHYRNKAKALEEELKALKESKGVPEALTKIPAEVDGLKKEYEEQMIVNGNLRKKCKQLESELEELRNQPEATLESFIYDTDNIAEDNQILKDMVIELLLEIRRSK